MMNYPRHTQKLSLEKAFPLETSSLL